MNSHEIHELKVVKYLHLQKLEFEKPLDERFFKHDILIKFLIASHLITGAAHERINPHDTINNVRNMFGDNDKILLEWFDKITAEILEFLNKYLFDK